MSEQNEQQDAVELAAELTMAYLQNPNTRIDPENIGQVLRQVHEAIQGLASSPAEPQVEAAPDYTPAVSARKSLSSPDHILSLIDGKPYKSLKRHLSRHGLTPQQYRERYGLKSDYPMVAESYAATRRELAKKIGLGRKPGQKAAGEAVSEPAAPAKAPAKRGRRKAEAPAQSTAGGEG